MKTMPLRQKVRAVTTVFFLITFPAYFYYLSPVIPVTGAVEGIVTGSLIMFVLMFVFSLFLGRGFCSYICPAGTIQDYVGKTKTGAFPRHYFNWIKYVVWSVWLIALFFFFRRAGGIRGLQFGYQTVNGLSVSDTTSLIVYLAVILLFFVMELIFGRRAACHTICWMAPFMVLGRKLSLLLKLPSLRISSQSRDCIDCGRCTEVCPMSLDVQKLQKKGFVRSTDCILCGKCIDVCPKNVLSFRWS